MSTGKGRWLSATRSITTESKRRPGTMRMADSSPDPNTRVDSIESTAVRVANVIEEGRLGGPQIRMVLAADAMRDRVETLIVMPDRPDSVAFRRRCDAAGVRYVALPLNGLSRSAVAVLRYGLTFPLEVLRLARLLRREKVDLVHVSGGAWQYKGVVAGKLAGKRVLWHLNDTSMPGVVRWMFRLLSPLAHGFIFASRRSEDYYRRWLRVERPTFSLPAPVDTDFFAPGGSGADNADGCGETRNGGLLVSTVANINPIKGLETLVRVAAVVSSERCDVTFLVVGPVFDGQRAYYRRLLALIDELGVSNVEFHGAVEDPRPLLERSDIYLCTSIAESSPLSVWEAMSMGKPVVSTDVGDVGLFVQPDAGALAAVGDAVGLAEQVLALAADPGWRARAGARGREKAVAHLDVRRCGERHVAIYRQAMGRCAEA